MKIKARIGKDKYIPNGIAGVVTFVDDQPFKHLSEPDRYLISQFLYLISQFLTQSDDCLADRIALESGLVKEIEIEFEICEDPITRCVRVFRR